LCRTRRMHADPVTDGGFIEQAEIFRAADARRELHLTKALTRDECSNYVPDLRHVKVFDVKHDSFVGGFIVHGNPTSASFLLAGTCVSPGDVLEVVPQCIDGSGRVVVTLGGQPGPTLEGPQAWSESGS
jgi:hypothetical protein